MLFVGCSGGGGRFDPGMLYYTPQIATSDDTDPVERVKIQYGTSFVYPLVSMTANVAASPNRHTGRITPFDFRAHAVMTGAFGYTMDLAKVSDDDCAAIVKQVSVFKHLRPLLASGRLYRLRSPFDGHDGSWMVVSEDKTQAVVFYFRFQAMPNAPLDRLRLAGLDTRTQYCGENGDEYTGAQLMNFGLPLPESAREYEQRVWYLAAK